MLLNCHTFPHQPTNPLILSIRVLYAFIFFFLLFRLRVKEKEKEERPLSGWKSFKLDRAMVSMKLFVFFCSHFCLIGKKTIFFLTQVILNFNLLISKISFCIKDTIFYFIRYLS